VPGLDSVLGQGLPAERLYLVQGNPGSGKTTMGLQFLLEGVDRGEPVLLVSLLQTRAELEDITTSHGWSLDGIQALEMPLELHEAAESEQTVFSPADVELHEVTDALIETILAHEPRRMVLDSLSELQLIIDSPHQMRRQLMKLKRALLSVGCTSIMTADEALLKDQPVVQTIVHGVFSLHRTVPDYGAPQRQLEVQKIRGLDFSGGFHDFVIRSGGLEVFPRFSGLGGGPRQPGDTSVVPSGSPELDAMFGGGLNRGSVCMVMGTAGAGKSTLTSLYVSSIADRGELGVVYCFDESRRTYLQRAHGLELGIYQQVEDGQVELREYSVGDLTPGQFMQDLRDDVEGRGARLVVIDSFTGFLNLMPGQSMLVPKLHEALRFLSSRNVLSLITLNVHGTLGEFGPDAPTSYLADALVLVRHFEAFGAIRRCLSVIKRRHGKHESAIRELEIGPGGIRLGKPLTEFTGLLTGTPRFHGRPETLLDRERGEPDAGGGG
jgi:circadian clock protein KaiC